MERKIYEQIAGLLDAIKNCKQSGNAEWEGKHWQALKNVMDTAPSGSGWDSGTTLDDESTPEKLVFTGSFHHMSEHGMYAGWTDHTITVRPSLQHGIMISVSGRDRNGIKEYLHELFWSWLQEKEILKRI
jgi:hypothetical protein